MDSLYSIAKKYGTDKADHGYCPYYERFLSSYKDRTCVLLELGIGAGASLRMWHEWLPMATIVGFDIAEKIQDFDKEPFFRIFKGDQSVHEDLDNMTNVVPYYDIIVDDAGHDRGQQRICFEHIWQRVVPGGWYIIEDITLDYPTDESVTFDVTKREVFCKMSRGESHFREVNFCSNKSGDGLLLLHKAL